MKLQLPNFEVTLYLCCVTLVSWLCNLLSQFTTIIFVKLWSNHAALQSILKGLNLFIYLYSLYVQDVAAKYHNKISI